MNPMPKTKTAPKASPKAKSLARKAKAPATKVAFKPKAPPAPRMTLIEAMTTLEKAGSAQTRKTYARHGAQEPMFGVSFAALKTLVKKIGVDHELSLEPLEHQNHDARILAPRSPIRRA